MTAAVEIGAAPSRLADPSNFQTAVFEREDWTLFRSVNTLCQRAGVGVNDIAAVVAKELLDNALDVAPKASGGWLPEHEGSGFYIEDSGPGIRGSDEEIASLFSIRRPLRSSKLLRLPTRGALGNGLRVVAGAVLSSGGRLQVSTMGRTLQLVPKDDGSTLYLRIGDYNRVGTRIIVILGPPLANRGALNLATRTLSLHAVNDQPAYKGQTSAWWYDADAFFELAQAAGSKSVRELISMFDGCSGAKAGRIAAAADLKGRVADSLKRNEIKQLLSLLRTQAKKVNPKRLCAVGKDPEFEGYSVERRYFRAGEAELPVVIEAWANTWGGPSLWLYVNRTCSTAQPNVWVEKTDLNILECGLNIRATVGRSDKLTVRLNVTSPYVPITSDGKEPDLSALRFTVADCIERAVRSAKRANGGTGRALSQRDVIFDNIVEAVEKASGRGTYQFSLRQLFYAVRPALIEAFGKEPEYNYFCQTVTEYESEKGEIRLMYRDDRGVLYHPHTGETIPLGTRSVARYKRPDWTFNKILYIEKEGFFEMLKDAQWPERHDCALLTSKGQPTRAARDLIDALGDTDEEILFFCIHDADAAGTIIYQSLQEATQARPKRKVKIINLGLEPEEAEMMALQVEAVESKKRRPVAGYVTDEWREWLQTNRVELNAMTAPQFVEWLDAKMEEHGQGKLIPPENVLEEELKSRIEDATRRTITEQVLRNAKIGERVAALMTELEPTIAQRIESLTEEVEAELEENPTESWTAPVERIASAIHK